MQTKRGYEVLTWPDVAKSVRAVNPGLANAIDEVDPPSNWKIVKARYAFGDEVLQKGELFVPHDDKLIGINDPTFNPELYKILNYNSMPVGVILNHSMELFTTYQDNVNPFSFMSPGRIFALWVALDDMTSPFRGKIWSLAAGCRSIFMLPKISDSVALNKLSRELGVHLQNPRSLMDQWTLFKTLAAFESNNPWTLEVIYFSQDWFKDSTQQKPLRLFLLNTAWRSTFMLRNDVIFDLLYSHAQEEKNIKIDPYLADTIKHLYLLGCGFYPGFTIADSDLVAPVQYIQDLFNNIYNLEYTPTLMHLSYLLKEQNKSIFYSLQVPTLLEFSPKSQSRSTNTDALYYIYQSMRRLKNYILSERPDMQGQPLYTWAETVNYQYFHSHNSGNQFIQPVAELLEVEPILQKEQQFFNKAFCDNNSFARGVIRLSLT